MSECVRQILIVDDQVDYANLIASRLLFLKLGLTVVTVKSGAEALKATESRFFDLVITDVEMPDGDGIWLLSHLSHQSPNTRVVMMTGGFKMTRDLALMLGAIDFIDKASSIKVIIDLIVKRVFDGSLYLKSA